MTFSVLLVPAICSFMIPQTVAAQDVPQWDVYSDTWDATDALGRSLPDSEKTGLPKKDKYIGVFYFLWHGRHGDEGPFDVTKILAQDPNAMQKKESPLWGRLYVPHHWGESVFGYYVGEDEGVLRKHAQMLGDAGVDVVIFDVTNQLTYPESYRKLCKVFHEIRAAGNHAPQIAFLTPFGAPKKVINELWRDFYSKGEYADLWFHWEGKPLILADPNLINGREQPAHANQPQELTAGHALGQLFTINKNFHAVAACTPTWNTTNASVTLTLKKDSSEGNVLLSQTFSEIGDNSWLALESEKQLPAGIYYLELSDSSGKIGWWTRDANDNEIDYGKGFIDGKPSEHQFVVGTQSDVNQTRQLLEFFTFRKPQPDYFIGPTGSNQWAWLEVYPQHGFYTLDLQGNKIVEQVAVGVAQNAADGKLSVLSNPKSHGRSFHNGKEPDIAEQDFTGRNFSEQWRRAFEIDPKFVFVTGWNEWIMGRFDENSPFYGDDVVSFVDQFNREFSRDIEPMKGGHGDAFYYQFIAYNRLFKGTRAVPKVTPKPVIINGRFDDWINVSPEFRDTIGDPAHRDERGWGKNTQYANQTGRNDIVAAKVSYDMKNIYFYVRTRDVIVGTGEPNWMMLFVDADGNSNTGWLGYDFVINRQPQQSEDGRAALTVSHASMEQNVGNKYEWSPLADIECQMQNKELELAVPLQLFDTNASTPHIPPFFRFKWADNIQQTGDWSDLTINGDVAPNDRYNYRAVLE
ncbi:MAG: hypothetical protein LBJ67_02380 [Planctomycetaceae bacterium]|nr:hypothetical protein [Planctomycetaceae bacterium]